MADHYRSCAPPAARLEVFTGLPLNLCFSLEARKQLSPGPPPSLSQWDLLSHCCSKHSLVMSALRTLQRGGSENREIPVKNKSSYSFSCFAGLFVKLVQFLLLHGWGSQAEGTEQWEVVAVAMLLRKRSTKSHLLQVLCAWRRFCSRGQWGQHAEGQAAPVQITQRLTQPLLPGNCPPSLVQGCSAGNVNPAPWAHSHRCSF